MNVVFFEIFMFLKKLTDSKDLFNLFLQQDGAFRGIFATAFFVTLPSTVFQKHFFADEASVTNVALLLF